MSSETCCELSCEVTPEKAEQLIKFLQSQEAIWQKKNLLHSNNKYVKRLREEIELKLNIPSKYKMLLYACSYKIDMLDYFIFSSLEEILKKKWCTLLHYFAKLYYTRAKSGSATIEAPSSWQYYRKLIFSKM